MGDDMSSDDIFAAQMWPWPDPLLKRDSQGRILFVNAAFLRIYGGQVQDWHGNSVGGWPIPSAGPVPNRFETRLPTPQGEMIFDWIEYTLADGGTLGLGRDVTGLVTTPDPDPAYRTTPPETNTHALYQEQNPAAQNPAAQVPAMNATPAMTATVAAAAHEAYQAPADDYVAPAENNVVPSYEIPSYEPEAVEVPKVDIPQFEAAPVEPPKYEPLSESRAAPAELKTQQTLHAETAADPAVAQASAPLQPADRDYERRALPIENEDSVLGSNWRDAVIAKAVGNVLPTNEAEPKVDETPAPSPKNGEGTLRILLAEDNAINALLTRTLLEADGCHVDVVEDGQLAVEAMKNQAYDMIFMDMRMPNMDGLESTRKIRALPNVSKDLPIVALTANAFDDDRNACFDSGMNDFMTKPVSAEELEDMVTQWARKKAEAA